MELKFNKCSFGHRYCKCGWCKRHPVCSRCSYDKICKTTHANLTEAMRCQKHTNDLYLLGGING